MKKLVKRNDRNQMAIKAFACGCGCYCRPYEDANRERFQSNTYHTTTSQ
ncbi:MAG TPA: putative bacteriocin precursor [Clostridium sp.]|nr:putative bacteriocin precursor [Clostridium sp.]